MVEEQGKAGERGEGEFAGINVHIDVSGDVQGRVNGVYIEHFHAGEPVKKWIPLDSLDRAEHFRGRDEEIAELKEKLKPGEMATIVAAGGMGKSALTARVVWELTNELTEPPEAFPDGVVAYTFYGGGSVSGAFTHIARAFGIEVGETEDSPAEAARRALSGKTALLALDGVEALREKGGRLGRLEDVLAIRGRCGVLITSRDRRDGKGTILELEPLDEDPAIAMVMAHGGDFAKEREAVLEICRLVGRLPLALRLAGSYLSANQMYAREYVDKLPERLWEDLSAEERQHESITVLMEESLGEVGLKPRDALGAASLLALAPFPVDWIVWGLVARWEEEEGAREAHGYRELEEVKDALGELGRYGLVKRMGENWQVSHALIRTYANEIGLAPEGALERLASLYARLATDANKKGYPAAFEGLRGHVGMLAEQAEAEGLEDAGTLWNNLGFHLKMIGDLREAQEMFARVLRIDEAAYGPENPAVASDVNNLGSVLQDMGDLRGAQEMYERALRIWEKAYGEELPQVATAVNNLGGVLQEQGDLARAREMYERALAIDEAIYGPEHPEVATDVNNLGGVLKNQGDLAGARKMYERALRIDEAAYGPEHPKVAIRVNNLGAVLRRQGDLAGAREMLERALRIWEKAYGEDHTQVATGLNGLGNVLRRQGDLARAQEMLERALRIDEAAYGPEHPKVATDVNNLGNILWDLGDLYGAKESYERTLAILSKFFPDGHPNIDNTTASLEKLNKEIEARDGDR